MGKSDTIKALKEIIKEKSETSNCLIEAAPNKELV
jgi:ferritin-like metal-binding protein YciE